MNNIGYKLTTQELTTRNDFQWEVGKTVKTSGKGELCTEGWLHYYQHPLLAVLHNPVHAAIGNPRLWECSVGEKIKRDGFMKSGATELTLLREIVLPVLTTEQRVEYAIRCALAVYEDDRFVKWANDWLSGEDRTEWSAEAARWAAKSAWAAAKSARWAAAAAADAWEAVAVRRAAEAALAKSAAAAAAEAAAALAADAACVEDVDLLKIAQVVCPNYQIEYVEKA